MKRICQALLWFKPEKIGWLLLRRGVLEAWQWKKLHCMIKGNNLFYISKLVKLQHLHIHI